MFITRVRNIPNPQGILRDRGRCLCWLGFDLWRWSSVITLGTIIDGLAEPSNVDDAFYRLRHDALHLTNQAFPSLDLDDMTPENCLLCVVHRDHEPTQRLDTHIICLKARGLSQSRRHLTTILIASSNGGLTAPMTHIHLPYTCSA
jgi:hypothetical protein